MGASIADVVLTDAGPAKHAAAVTPDDDADLGHVTRILWVGGTGDVAVIMADGETVTFAAVPAGSLLPIQVVRVLEATDASSIVALW